MAVCTNHSGTPGTKLWHRGPSDSWRVGESTILCATCVAEMQAMGWRLFVDQTCTKPVAATPTGHLPPVVAPKPEKRTCTVPACDGPENAGGRCAKCHSRARTNGWLELEPEGDLARWHANIRLRAEAGSAWHKKEMKRLLALGPMLTPPRDDPWYSARLEEECLDALGTGGEAHTAMQPSVEPGLAPESGVRDDRGAGLVPETPDSPPASPGRVPEHESGANVRELALTMEALELRQALTRASERLAAFEALRQLDGTSHLPVHGGDASWVLLRALLADVAHGRVSLRHLVMVSTEAQGDKPMRRA